MKYFQSDKKSNQAGFSLLEMLIAVSLFIIVTGSIYTLLELGRSDRNRTSRRGDTQKNARIAMYLIGRDVMNAGLGYHKTGSLVPDDFLANRLGVAVDPNAGRDTLTSVACGNNGQRADQYPPKETMAAFWHLPLGFISRVDTFSNARSTDSRRRRSDHFNYCTRAPAILLPLVTTGSSLSCSLTITTTCVMSSKALL